MGPIATHHGEELTMEAVVDNVLEIEDLRVSFYTEEGKMRAVDGVSFSISRGSIMELVRERVRQIRHQLFGAAADTVAG